MKDVFISEVGLAKFGKRDLSLEGLASEALGNLSAKSPIALDEIDAVFFGNMSGEKFTNNSNLSSWVVDHLGLSGKPAMRIDTGSSSGAAVFQAGVQAVASGCYKNVLVLASEKMTHVPTVIATRILAEVIDPIERSYGCTMTALAAMITNRYMHEFGLTSDELTLVSVKNHYNGSLNPYAHFQKIIEEDKVKNSKVIAEPLRLFDCSPISDGAAAVLLTSKPNQVKVIGIGHGTTHVAVQYRNSYTSFEATKIAAKQAYNMADKGPDQIDVAEVHDAFTSFEIINTEDLGFFNPGQGRETLISGETKLDGRLPINPSGGLKARGHPVGVSGLAQIVEIVWQLRREAGNRQVKDPKIGLTQSIGGLASNNLVNILEVV
jgi:acetyl-CoA C-acetyltransferase